MMKVTNLFFFIIFPVEWVQFWETDQRDECQIIFLLYLLFNYKRKVLQIFDSNSNICLIQVMSIKKINGYKIKMDSVLGHAAYGSVYKGEQDGSKLECAIKVIDKRKGTAVSIKVCKDPYLKSAMDSQIQIMSKLKSNNIVGFFDVLMSSHNYYIVQELCDGDLEHYLEDQQGKKICEQLAINFLTQICNGFIALVKEGVVHRDLKPANILMSKGELKIADFGFAKANIHKNIKNESCVGTPLYMSVEVLKSSGYTSKCDIWSIGCIFYQMIHGKTPWSAKSEYELVQSIMNKPLTFDDNIGEDTKDFLTKALQPKQQNRICWDDVFKHPIFIGYFDSYIDQNTEFENKYKKVMSDLRFKINSQNIDLQKLWQNLGFEEEKGIDFKEFVSFLELVNPDMIKCEQTYFFERLDSEGSGKISLQKLTKELQKHQISTRSKHKDRIPFGIKKINTMCVNMLDESNQSIMGPEIDEQFQKRVRNCFMKLHKIISSKKLTLYKTFMVYDKSNSGELTIDEFSKILKKLDNSFTSEQLQAAFDLIDEDGSKTIEFDQLNSYYCKVNCIPLESKFKSSSRKLNVENQFD